MTLAPAQRPSRARQRRGLAIALLLAWSAGLIALVRREFFRERAAILAEAAMRLPPGVSYYIVEQGGRQVGFASTTIDTTGTTFEVVDYFIADLPVAGREFRASARSVITLSRALSLRRFDVQIETPEAPMSASGMVEGDSAVRFVLRMPGQPTDTQRLAVKGPILVPTLLPAATVLVASPKVGRTVTLASFDPRTMSPADIRFRIAAESLFTVIDSAAFDADSARFIAARSDTVRAWRLEPADAESGGGFAGWVDANGSVVASTQPGGLSLRRVAYEIAFENWRRSRAQGNTTRDTARGTVGDLLAGTAIAAGERPVGAAPRILTVRLSGVALDGFDLRGGRQTLEGDQLTVMREPADLLVADYTLGSGGRGFRARFAAELAEEPLLQVSDREITALAVRIAGNSRDPAIVAERINRWVHDSLQKKITISVPSAVQVLRARSGDCNEHTQLYVALARAAGIPARISTGLAFVNDRFYYHAWPEVRLRDWVAVDPTFGQFPADAAHLRFVRGGLAQQGELLRLVGSLKIEVLNAR